jgi:hypothetical protein
MNMSFVVLHTAVFLNNVACIFAAIFCSCILISGVCEEEVLIVIGSFILFIMSAIQIRIIENKVKNEIPKRQIVR